MIRLAALRARHLDARAGGAAVAGLAAALVAVGWRAVGDPSPEELAGFLVELVDACVSDHGDPDRLVSDVARLLRDHGPLLDGGLPPVDAYEPAAIDVLERYVREETRRPEPGFGDG